MALSRTRIRIRVSIGVALLALIIVAISLGTNTVRKPFEYITQPFARAGYSLALWVGSLSNPFEDTDQLREQLSLLSLERESLIRENSALKTLIGEQEAVAGLEGYINSLEEQGTIAHVIGKIGGTQQMLLIDKGNDHGIQKNQAVIANQGILIGTVHSTTDRTSRIALLIDESQSVAAKIQNESSSPGVVRGEFGLSLIMELIPQTDAVEKGQYVVTSALEPIVPPNILIGTVTSIENNEGEIFQRAHIAPPIALDRVELVSVITSRNE